MGDLVDLLAWKKRKEDKKHQREIDEVRSLRSDLMTYLEEFEDLDSRPFSSESERESWAKKAVQIMISTLDGYKRWPIDSSDM